MLTRDVTESDLTTFNLERRKSRQFSRNRTFPPEPMRKSYTLLSNVEVP